MSTVLNEILEANKRYSSKFGDKGKLALPPARRFAVLTCMDARMDPAKFAGLAEGDAHVIRNAVFQRCEGPIEARAARRFIDFNSDCRLRRNGEAARPGYHHTIHRSHFVHAR